jgi:hypothetical protein
MLGQALVMTNSTISRTTSTLEDVSIQPTELYCYTRAAGCLRRRQRGSHTGAAPPRRAITSLCEQKFLRRFFQKAAVFLNLTCDWINAAPRYLNAVPG